MLCLLATCDYSVFQEYRCRAVRNGVGVVSEATVITPLCSLTDLEAGASYQFSVIAMNSVSTSPSVMINVNQFPSIGL